jgi:hypothetical protein
VPRSTAVIPPHREAEIPTWANHNPAEFDIDVLIADVTTFRREIRDAYIPHDTKIDNFYIY